MLSQAVWPGKAADGSIMDEYCPKTLALAKIQCQTLLKLC